MRHGLDDERYVGGYSNIGLTYEGIKQVESSTKYIKKLHINKIVCSDVFRAKQTANIINIELNKDIIVDSDLRELNKGKLNGMHKELARVLYPSYFEKLSIYDRYPDGESMEDLYKRIKILLSNIDKYDNDLLVTHRGVINMIYYILNSIKLDMDKQRFNVEHASIHELDFEKKLIRRVY